LNDVYRSYWYCRFIWPVDGTGKFIIRTPVELRPISSVVAALQILPTNREPEVRYVSDDVHDTPSRSPGVRRTCYVTFRCVSHLRCIFLRVLTRPSSVYFVRRGRVCEHYTTTPLFFCIGYWLSSPMERGVFFISFSVISSLNVSCTALWSYRREVGYRLPHALSSGEPRLDIQIG